MVAGRARAAGWDARVFDAYSFPRSADVIATTTDASVIGMSIHGAPSVPAARTIIDTIRERSPQTAVIVGGNLANAAPRLLHSAFPDCFLHDGGAATAVDTLEAVCSLSNAIGIAGIPTPDQSWEAPDLDALEVPFVNYLSDPDFEYNIPTQIGCPFRCFHCGTGRRGLYSRVILRPLDELLAELHQLTVRCQSLGMPLPPLWITDETFTSSEDHAQSVCDILAVRALRGWRAQTRVDSVDSRMLHAMKTARCETVAFGIEVPSDDGLTLFGKRELMDRAEYAFRSAREAGLRVEAILVFGAPEDRSSFTDVFERLNQLGPDSLQTYIYHPVPGSPWWRRLGEQLPLNCPDDWARLDFHSPPVCATTADARRETIARFLASLVWRPNVLTSPELLALCRRLLEGEACRRCGMPVRARFFHAIDTVKVLCVDSSEISEELLLAIGPTEAVACPVLSVGNLHASLRFLSAASNGTIVADLCRCHHQDHVMPTLALPRGDAPPRPLL